MSSTRHVVLAACGLLAAARLAAQQPSGTLVVSNMNDHTATIIDVGTNTVRATVQTGEGPHEVAASRDGKWALVSNYGVRGKPGNTITVIDVARAAVARTIDLGEYQRPHGMRFLPGDTLVAVTSEGKGAVLLVDVRSGAVTRAVPTSGRGSHMLAVSAAGDRLVTGNIADATVSILSTTGGEPRLVTVARQPEGIALSPDGNTIWVGSNRDSLVLVVDARRGVATDTIRGFGLPYRLAVSPNGRSAVVTDPMTAKVRIFDAATRRERFSLDIPRDSILPTAEVPGSPSPEGLAISNDSRWAFVTLQGRNRVVTIDLDRGRIVGWAPTGTWSDGVAYSPVAGRR